MAAIGKFESEETVIDFLNTARVGLAGYFFSRDAGQVWRVADALEGKWLQSYDITNLKIREQTPFFVTLTFPFFATICSWDGWC